MAEKVKNDIKAHFRLSVLETDRDLRGLELWLEGSICRKLSSLKEIEAVIFILA